MSSAVQLSGALQPRPESVTEHAEGVLEGYFFCSYMIDQLSPCQKGRNCQLPFCSTKNKHKAALASSLVLEKAVGLFSPSSPVSSCPNADRLHLFSQPPEHTMSLCSTDYSPWPPSTFLCHCCKQSCVMYQTQMYHRCIFAQVSSHPTELTCYSCFFTKLVASLKFDLATARMTCFLEPTNCQLYHPDVWPHSSPGWQIYIFYFFLTKKTFQMPFTKILLLLASCTHPFKPIWDKHKA